MKSRIFIIGPTESGVYYDDTLHTVARHFTHKDLDVVYGCDLYTELASFGDKTSAIRYAKKHGAKRPTVI